VKYSAKSDKNGVSAASFLLADVILKILKGVVSSINFNGWLFLLSFKKMGHVIKNVEATQSKRL
jgi:hypothetical protein